LFDQRDRAGALEAFIINEAMVERFYPDDDPLGKHLVYNWGEPIKGEIVGVVGNVRHAGLDGEPMPAIYRPYAQKDLGFLHLVVRTDGDPHGMTRALAAELQAIDPDQPLAAVRTLESILSSSISSQRFNMTLLATFAGMALILASLGIYGIISYTVSQRAHEMGIRVALGAQSRDVVQLVAKQGLQLTGLGLVLGLALALATSRALSTLVFGITTKDSLTFLAAPVILAVVALLACLLPAMRATKVDPVVALRCE
jgi:putative ABC transport system permease protein